MSSLTINAAKQIAVSSFAIQQALCDPAFSKCCIPKNKEVLHSLISFDESIYSTKNQLAGVFTTRINAIEQSKQHTAHLYNIRRDMLIEKYYIAKQWMIERDRAIICKTIRDKCIANNGVQYISMGKVEMPISISTLSMNALIEIGR